MKNNAYMFAIVLYFIIQIITITILFTILFYYNLFLQNIIILILITELILILSSIKFVLKLQKQLKAKIKASYLKQQINLMNKHNLERLKLKHFSKTLQNEINHHLNTLKNFINSNNYTELSNYISNQCDNLNDTIIQTEFCSRPAINAAMCYLNQLAKDSGVYTDFVITNANNIHVPDLQLCILLLNLIENAIEAASLVENGYVYLRTFIKNNKSIIKIENSAINFSSKFLTSKKNKEEHGLGIYIVKSIVKEYNGHMTFNFVNNVLTCIVAI